MAGGQRSKFDNLFPCFMKSKESMLRNKVYICIYIYIYKYIYIYIYIYLRIPVVTIPDSSPPLALWGGSAYGPYE